MIVAAGGRKPSAFNHAVGEDDARVGQDERFVSHGSRCRELLDVDDFVGDRPTDLIVMRDCNHRSPTTLFFRDEIDDHRAIAGVQRSRRLVKQQDRLIREKPARDVDALLLTA